MTTPRRCDVAVSGARIATTRHGEGPPLALCHGGPGGEDRLEPVARMLAGLTVLRFDQRGCGRSSSGGPHTLEQLVADMEGLRRHFGYERWAVGGHSWGANLALAYAAAHPTHVTALVYLSGTGIDPDWHHHYRLERTRRLGAAALRELASIQGSPAEQSLARKRLFYPTEFADPARAREANAPSHVNLEVNRCVFASWTAASRASAFAERLARMHAPALLIHGEEDPRPLFAIQDLAARLPHAEVAVIRRAGHYPWLEEPEALARQLAAFSRRAQALASR